MILPVITLHQPWATWIMRGWKTIETRTHSRFSGLIHKTILIHAGLSTDESAINNEYLTKDQLLENPNEMVNGYIIGKAYVYGFALLNDSHSKQALIDCKSVKRYGLFLSDIVKFETPIPAKGEQSIWYFDMENMRKYPGTPPKNQPLFDTV